MLNIGEKGGGHDIIPSLGAQSMHTCIHSIHRRPGAAQPKSGNKRTKSSRRIGMSAVHRYVAAGGPSRASLSVVLGLGRFCGSILRYVLSCCFVPFPVHGMALVRATRRQHRRLSSEPELGLDAWVGPTQRRSTYLVLIGEPACGITGQAEVLKGGSWRAQVER